MMNRHGPSLPNSPLKGRADTTRHVICPEPDTSDLSTRYDKPGFPGSDGFCSYGTPCGTHRAGPAYRMARSHAIRDCLLT